MVLSDRDLKKRLKTADELGLPKDFLERVSRRDMPKELRDALEAGLIVMDSIPPDEWFDGDTMDLAFGNVIEVPVMPLEKVRIDGQAVIRRFTLDFRQGSMTKRFDHTRSVDIVEESRHRFTINDDETFELQPDMMILAYTKQVVCVPHDLQMQIGGRSKIARAGISVHVSSPVFHPGWCGHATMEIKNGGQFAFNIYPGLQFAPVFFNQMSSPVERPYHAKSWARYSGQR